jgi:hypothetical protein
LTRGPVVAVAEIDELVERVLRETGRLGAAREYAAIRDQRVRARREIEVLRDVKAADVKPRDVKGRDVKGGGGVRAYGAQSQPWSKGKIVEALQMEAELPREIAEAVASAVEARVFASGYRRVSTGLLRELVDNELFTRGLETHLRRQTLVGLPKHDLREALRTGFFRSGTRAHAPGSTEPWVAWTGRLEDRIARHVLGKFTLEEVLTPRLADRHLSGDLSFDGLDTPHRAVAGAVRLTAAFQRAGCGSPGLDGAGAPAAAFEDVLDFLRAAAASYGDAVGGTLVLWDWEGLLTRFARGARRGRLTEMAARALRAVASGRGAPGAVLALDANGPWAEAFADAAASLPPPADRPRLVLTNTRGGVALPEAFAAEAASVKPDAARQGFVASSFGGGDGLTALGPGLRVDLGARGAVPELVTTHAAAILNLPRLAYLAGAYNEGRVLELAVDLVDDAVEGLCQLDRFRAETRESRAASSPFGLDARPALAVGVVGLRECVRFVHEGVVEPLFARELVQAIVERTRAVAATRQVPVFFDPWFPTAARGGFEALDAEQHRASEHFSDGDRVCYSEGATLSPVSGQAPGAAEGEALVGVDAGVLPPRASLSELFDFAAAFERARGTGPRAGVKSRGAAPPRSAAIPPVSPSPGTP